MKIFILAAGELPSYEWQSAEGSRMAARALKTEQPGSDLPSSGDRVGAEIRHLRKARDFTIAQLAEAASVSVGYISQVERGVSSPSVRGLHAISRALGVTISWFFSPAHGDDDDLRDIVVRAGARRVLTFDNNIRDELLSPDLGRKLELLRSVFPPGTTSGEATYSHKGEEAGFVIAGRLTLWVGERRMELGEGDSFAFSSQQPHRYANPGQSETVVIWAITPPSY